MEDIRISIKRTYKDSVFKIVFQEKEELLDLYNALSDNHYDNPNDLQINTLEDVIYLGMKNDISFLIDSRLNLFEHQSTFNPNMPLRGLFYISDVYKTMYFKEHRIYSDNMINIATPRYFVFYNGEEEMPDRMDLRLSDAFQSPTDTPDVEVVAHMININAGHNQALLNKCQKLKEYTYFVEAVREFVSNSIYGNKETCIKQAVEYCISNHILEDILRKERVKIMASILSEFDEKAYAEMLLEEGREKGLAEGRAEGRAELLELLVSLVKEGQLSVETAAEKCGMTADAFREKMMP